MALAALDIVVNWPLEKKKMSQRESESSIVRTARIRFNSRIKALDYFTHPRLHKISDE